MHRFWPTAMVATALWLGGCSRSKPPAHVYSMGEKVYAGRLIYTVFETQYLTQIPLEPTPRIPQHRFLLVRISAGNSAAEEVSVPPLTLEDDHGVTYDELSDGRGVPQWVSYLRSVKPGNAIQGWAVFDAPPKHYKLRAMDENSDRATLIDIPLSFGSENPDIALPTPKQ